MMTPAPYLALGLGGPHLLELTSHPNLLDAWDDLPLAFTVLGLDRIDGSEPAEHTLDSSAVGAALAGRTSRGRFLVVASPQRDHPYNLARRTASLGHLSRGRSGVLFGVRDSYAAPGPAGAEAWGGANLGPGHPLDAATALDAVTVVRELEKSWPFDSVLGDRRIGILVQSDRIVHVDHDRVWSVAGPLNVPEPPTGPSVTAWWADSGSAAAPARGAVDLVVGPGGDVEVVRLGGSLPSSSASAGRLLVATPDTSLPDLLTAARQLLDNSTPLGPATLRDALGLAPAAPLARRRAAFPVPQPHPSL